MAKLFLQKKYTEATAEAAPEKMTDFSSKSDLILQTDSYGYTPAEVAFERAHYTLISMLAKTCIPLHEQIRKEVLHRIAAHEQCIVYPYQDCLMYVLLKTGTVLPTENLGTPEQPKYLLDGALEKHRLDVAKILLLANAPLTSFGITVIKELKDSPRTSYLLPFALACQDIYGKSSIKKSLSLEEYKNLEPEVLTFKNTILTSPKHKWLLEYGKIVGNPAAAIRAAKRGKKFLL